MRGREEMNSEKVKSDYQMHGGHLPGVEIGRFGQPLAPCLSQQPSRTQPSGEEKKKTRVLSPSLYRERLDTSGA